MKRTILQQMTYYAPFVLVLLVLLTAIFVNSYSIALQRQLRFHDEALKIGRSAHFDAVLRGELSGPLWEDPFAAKDHPKLAGYIFGALLRTDYLAFQQSGEVEKDCAYHSFLLHIGAATLLEKHGFPDDSRCSRLSLSDWPHRAGQPGSLRFIVPESISDDILFGSITQREQGFLKGMPQYHGKRYAATIATILKFRKFNSALLTAVALIVSLLTLSLFGRLPALVACVACGFNTTLVQSSSLALTDIYLVLLGALSLCSMAAFFLRKEYSLPLLLLTSTLCSLTLQIKLTGVFICFAFVALLALQFFRREIPLRRAGATLSVFCAVCLGLFILHDPSLWNNPISGVLSMLTHRASESAAHTQYIAHFHASAPTEKISFLFNRFLFHQSLDLMGFRFFLPPWIHSALFMLGCIQCSRMAWARDHKAQFLLTALISITLSASAILFLSASRYYILERIIVAVVIGALFSSVSFAIMRSDLSRLFGKGSPVD